MGFLEKAKVGLLEKAKMNIFQTKNLDAKSKKLLMVLIKTIAIGISVLIFLNGLVIHHIKETNLEQTFVERVLESGLSEGEVLLNQVHGNSVTFLFQNDKNEMACGTYSKSLYTRNWKEEKFYNSQMGILETGETTYKVNDKLTSYDITCSFVGEPQVTFGEEEKPILPIKVFGVMVIMFAAIAGRIIGMAKLKR